MALTPPYFCARTLGQLQRLPRFDASEAGKGKPCGASHIPKGHKCTKGTGFITAGNLKTAAKVALAAGLVAGGAYLAKHKFQSMEEWRNSPENPRNNPKLSPERAKQITDEAIAGGQKWDVQEQINARRFQLECGGGLGKISAPAKLDAALPTPRCQAGEGAFGTYFVHPSQEYGVKLYRNGDEDDVDWEFDRLGRAHAAGVNVPEPLSMNAVRDEHGDIRAQTLVLRHMRGYRTIDDEYHDAYGTASNAPNIVQLKVVREFRKLHTEGLAHGDIHSGNIMVHPRSKKVAIIDFGYSTSITDDFNPHHSRNGVQNLLSDLRRLPRFVGFTDSAAEDFLKRHQGVIDNIKVQAKDYNRSWEKYDLGIKRYHDALERELLWDERKPRSRFVSGADQPRIPGLTRRILTAQRNTAERQMMEEIIAQHPNPAAMLAMGAEALKAGVKPANLYAALQPEREARRARLKKQPFGTALRPSPTKLKKTPAGAFRVKPGTPTGMRRIKPGVDEFTDKTNKPFSSWKD